MPRLQRRDLQLPRAAQRASIARGSSVSHAHRLRDDRPPLRGARERVSSREFNGMFAFALWDTRKRAAPRRPRSARGQAAVLPLGRRSARIRLGGSRARRGRLRAPELDPDALVELLTFQNIISMRSVFRGVEMLPPATTLTLDDTGLVTERYWDPQPRPNGVPDAGELVEQVRATFDRAVERQLVSDVEVASYLSGGLDSSAVDRRGRSRAATADDLHDGIRRERRRRGSRPGSTNEPMRPSSRRCSTLTTTSSCSTRRTSSWSCHGSCCTWRSRG